LVNLAGLFQKVEGIAMSLVWETANFQEVEMIVIAHLISKYRVGLYQLIDFGLFAVPPDGKTRPAPYFWRSPSYIGLF